jgi:hypothetical protein
MKGNGRSRLKPEAIEGAQGNVDVRLIEADEEIQIRGSAQITVKHNGNATHHDVSDSRFTQCRQEKLDIASHFSIECSSGRAVSSLSLNLAGMHETHSSRNTLLIGSFVRGRRFRL